MMNTMIRKMPCKPTYLILLSAGLLVLAIVCILTTYRTYSCTSLCISSFSQRADYMVAAKLSYAGQPLAGTKLTVIINGAYKSTLATDQKSSLLFQAPLKIGLNTIEVKYGDSESSVSFFYAGGLLYILLIPLGALFFLSLKSLASDSTKTNKVAFHSDDVSYPDPEGLALKNAIDSYANRVKRIVPGLPERVANISAELARISKAEGSARAEKDSCYLSKKIEAEQVSFVAFGCVSHEPVSKETAAALELYESSLVSGTSVLNAKSPKAFLSANGVIFRDYLSIATLSKTARKGSRTRLFLFGCREEQEVSRLARSCTKIGAMLLLLQEFGTLEIITLGG